MSPQLCLTVELLLAILALDDVDRVLVHSQGHAGGEAPATLVTDVSLGYSGSSGNNNR